MSASTPSASDGAIQAESYAEEEATAYQRALHRVIMWISSLDDCIAALRLAQRVDKELDASGWPKMAEYLHAIAAVQITAFSNSGHGSEDALGNTSQEAQALRDELVSEAFLDPTVLADFQARLQRLKTLRDKLIGHVDASTAGVVFLMRRRDGGIETTTNWTSAYGPTPAAEISTWLQQVVDLRSSVERRMQRLMSIEVKRFAQRG